jgi:hypothetical protein
LSTAEATLAAAEDALASDAATAGATAERCLLEPVSRAESGTKLGIGRDDWHVWLPERTGNGRVGQRRWATHDRRADALRLHRQGGEDGQPQRERDSAQGQIRKQRTCHKKPQQGTQVTRVPVGVGHNADPAPYFPADEMNGTSSHRISRPSGPDAPKVQR